MVLKIMSLFANISKILHFGSKDQQSDSTPVMNTCPETATADADPEVEDGSVSHSPNSASGETRNSTSPSFKMDSLGIAIKNQDNVELKMKELETLLRKQKTYLQQAAKEKNQSERSKLEDLKRQIGEREKKLCQEKANLETEVAMLKHENDALKRQNQDLQKEVCDLKSCQQLQQFQRPMQNVHLKVHCPLKQELADTIVNELTQSLICHLEMSGTHLTVERCLPTEPPTATDGLPVMVLCMNASRLGTDVAQALRGILYGKNVLMVVLHHKEMHALPTQPSEKLLLGKEYKPLAAIVDVAFLSGKGMYPCDMNNTAMERISQFLTNFVN